MRAVTGRSLRIRLKAFLDSLMAESEERGLRVRHRAVVRPLVEKYRGESIEARGDESLSVFPTALDAVNCALAIEIELRDSEFKRRTACWPTPRSDTAPLRLERRCRFFTR